MPSGATLPTGELSEKVGEYLVPDIMHVYQKLLRPEWKTRDMQEYTENSSLVLEVSRLGGQRADD